MKYTTYQKSGAADIKQLFKSVFSSSESDEEGTLIAGLVEEMVETTNDQDIYGFIVKHEDKLIGSVFFTRLSFKVPVEAFILSPIAISTEYQGRGIGQKLINFGLEQLKKEGVELVITYGDPSFYSKVGFQEITENIIQAPCKLSYPHGWLGQSLEGKAITPIKSKPTCVKALKSPKYW